MADFDLGEGLRRVFLAGVGALATGVELGQQSFEKSQQIVDGLVKKGELTVEHRAQAQGAGGQGEGRGKD